MICSHQNLRAYTHTKLAPLFFDTFLVSMRILLIWNKNMVSSHDGRYHFRANTFKTTRATSSAIFVCKDENPTVHCSSVETSSRNSCKELGLLSDFYAILRFFRLYDSSDCYSPIFPILRVVRDSPIFPIIRFFRFSDSPSSTRFSHFPIVLRFYLFFRFDDSSNYSTNLRTKSELEAFKLLFCNMITYNALWIQCLLYSRFKDYFIFPLAFNRSSISSLCVSITNHMNALNLIQPFVCKCV